MVCYPKKVTIVAFILLVSTLIFAGCGKFGASAKVDKQLELAVKYLSENNFEEAILAYKEVVAIDKKNVTAYKGLGIAYSIQGKPEQAEQSLQDGLKQVSGSNTLKLALAGLQADQGKKDQAEAIYKEIITQDEKYLPAYQAYTELLMALNRQEDAVALLEKASSANAGQYKIYSMLAEQYLYNGDREKALAAINQSLSTEPNQADAYRLLEGLYSNGATEFNALGEQYIQQGKALPGQIIKLTGLYQLGKYDDMLKLYEQLANDLKGSPKLRMLVAQAYLKLGKKDQGVNLGRDVKLEDIKDAALLAEIANFYLVTGDKNVARSLAIKGISLDDMLVDNYIILSKSFQDEDKSQVDIWLIKYILSSALSVKEAQNSKEESLEQKTITMIEKITEAQKVKENEINIKRENSGNTKADNNGNSNKEIDDGLKFVQHFTSLIANRNYVEAGRYFSPSMISDPYVKGDPAKYLEHMFASSENNEINLVIYEVSTDRKAIDFHITRKGGTTPFYALNDGITPWYLEFGFSGPRD